MRDIKFRAWDKRAKEYPSISIPELFNGDLLLEQYTGLNDRNGKEIYEGDILEFMDAPGLGYGKATVIWYTDRASFFVENDDIDIFDYLFDMFDYSQIIGNIHEDSK